MGVLRSSVPQIVYGGIDGTISTFAVVAGAFGAGLEPKMAFILGAAAIGSDGLSMAVGAYLSAGAARQAKPKRIGLVTFVAFATLGSCLLLPYLLDLFIDMPYWLTFSLSGVFALISFAIVGYIKAGVDGQSAWKGIKEVVLLGVLAAAVAYLLGDGLERLIV